MMSRDVNSRSTNGADSYWPVERYYELARSKLDRREVGDHERLDHGRDAPFLGTAGNDECLHRVILRQAEPVHRTRRLRIALLDPLPELAIVVPTRERRHILLRLVLEDRQDLAAQLVARHRHEHVRLVHRPLLPRTAV